MSFFTKQNYLQYRQCPSLLWYNWNTPDLIPSLSQAEFKMRQGKKVELLSHKLFPQGTSIDHSQPFNDTLKQSKEAIKRPIPDAPSKPEPKQTIKRPIPDVSSRPKPKQIIKRPIPTIPPIDASGLDPLFQQRLERRIKSLERALNDEHNYYWEDFFYSIKECIEIETEPERKGWAKYKKQEERLRDFALTELNARRNEQ
ncbi:hypothetical protein ACFLS1_10875 [Verrucomicrobiota bacterium]